MLVLLVGAGARGRAGADPSQRRVGVLRAAASSTGRRHYPAMVRAAHRVPGRGRCSRSGSCGRVFVPALGWTALALVVASQALRWWCITSLGRHWSTRVVVVPGDELVTRGPYRFVKHPNYVAVVVEGLALPLVHTAWITAIVVHRPERRAAAHPDPGRGPRAGRGRPRERPRARRRGRRRRAGRAGRGAAGRTRRAVGRRGRAPHAAGRQGLRRGPDAGRLRELELLGVDVPGRPLAGIRYTDGRRDVAVAVRSRRRTRGAPHRAGAVPRRRRRGRRGARRAGHRHRRAAGRRRRGGGAGGRRAAAGPVRAGRRRAALPPAQAARARPSGAVRVVPARPAPARASGAVGRPRAGALGTHRRGVRDSGGRRPRRRRPPHPGAGGFRRADRPVPLSRRASRRCRAGGWHARRGPAAAAVVAPGQRAGAARRRRRGLRRRPHRRGRGAGPGAGQVRGRGRAARRPRSVRAGVADGEPPVRGAHRRAGAGDPVGPRAPGDRPRGQAAAVPSSVRRCASSRDRPRPSRARPRRWRRDQPTARETPEVVVLLDDEGRATGTMDKALVHHARHASAPGVLGLRAGRAGRLLVTRRALGKRTFPGVWTNTVCGHPAPGEDLVGAATRRGRAGARAAPDRTPAWCCRGSATAPRWTVWWRTRSARCWSLGRPTTTCCRTRRRSRTRAGSRGRRSPPAVLDGSRAVSPWCAEQVAELVALGPDPSRWPAAHPDELPPALG